MKIPWLIPCLTEGCDERFRVETEMFNEVRQVKCPSGHEVMFSPPSDTRLGYRMMHKVEHELLDRKDYDMTILFAAMAVEWDIARLFSKWKKIDFRLGPSGTSKTEEELDQEYEDEYRELRTFVDRFKTTAKLMHAAGITDFLDKEKNKKTIDRGFPSLAGAGLPKMVHAVLMMKRNEIVHRGKTGFTEEDAIRCHNVAGLTLAVLETMDLERQR